MGRIGAFLAVVACVVVGVGAAAAATSPAALRSAILRAMLAKHSVRYLTASTTPGTRLTMVSDVAADRGIQRVTLVKSGRTGHMTTLVVRSTAYIRGDSFGLVTYMRFPARIASRYAGRWISITPSSPLYRPVAIDATYGSFVGDALPEHNLSLVSGTVGGRKVRGLRGTAREGGILTLYVPRSGTPLPIAGRDVAAAQSATSRVSLSRWNEPVNVQAPAHAVPISKVH